MKPCSIKIHLVVACANTTVSQDQFVPFFETVIRYLGGFLSAYALTGRHVFLERADELGQVLLPAFQFPLHVPSFSVNTQT